MKKLLALTTLFLNVQLMCPPEQVDTLKVDQLMLSGAQIKDNQISFANDTTLSNSELELLFFTLQQMKKPITHLDLSAKAMSFLPANIGKFVHLKTLKLEGNTKLKSLPTSITLLENLEYLSLPCQLELSRFEVNTNTPRRSTFFQKKITGPPVILDSKEKIQTYFRQAKLGKISFLLEITQNKLNLKSNTPSFKIMGDAIIRMYQHNYQTCSPLEPTTEELRQILSE